MTGLVVNDAPACRATWSAAAGHSAPGQDGRVAAQNRDGAPNFRAWVEGMIAYIAMSRPILGAKLRLALSKVAG